MRYFMRNALSAAVLAFVLSPVAGFAVTSTGADGSFNPTASVVLDATQSIFNFTDIFIPAGVAVSFSGLASAQPIELLATGNINIAGTLDAGSNSLLLEAPGTINLSGSLKVSGSLSIFIDGATGIGGAPLGNGSAGVILTSCTANCTVLSPPMQITFAPPAGVINITAPPVLIATGGEIGNITLTCNNCSQIPLDPVLTLSPVPEPDSWALLLFGLIAMFAMSRRNWWKRQLV
jgi:hypothetical protein